MNNLSIKIPFLLGLAGSGLLASQVPAHAVAVQYVFQNATLTNSVPPNTPSPLTGSFFFDSVGSTYSNWSVSAPAGTLSNFTYTTANSTFATPSIFDNTTLSSANKLILTVNDGSSQDGRQLYLSFGSALLGVVGQTASISTQPFPSPLGSSEGLSGNFRTVIGGTNASVQGVPLETDALPVAATTVLVGGAFWLRNRKRSQVTLDLAQTPETEKVSV